MSRPDSEHTKALHAFRDRLVAARRAASRETDLDVAMRRFIEIETAIDLVDRALGDEMDLTPIPTIDDPLAPSPFLDSAKGPPIIERL